MPCSGAAAAVAAAEEEADNSDSCSPCLKTRISWTCGMNIAMVSGGTSAVAVVVAEEVAVEAVAAAADGGDNSCDQTKQLTRQNFAKIAALQ